MAEGLKYRALYRTLLFLPYAVPGFISILVFKGLFNQNFGEINAILDALSSVCGRPGLPTRLLAKVMILIVNTWLGYPYIMILCSWPDQGHPERFVRSQCDCRRRAAWTNFFKITAPLDRQAADAACSSAPSPSTSTTSC